MVNPISQVVMASPHELAVQRADGSRFAIHPIWLRERSHAGDAYDAHTAQRLFDPSDVDLALTVTAVEACAPGRFKVTFSDGHTAEFSAQDLLAEARVAEGSDDTPPVELWDGASREPARAPWTSTPTDAEKAGWLEQFLKRGFIVFSGVPSEPGTVLKVGEQFGFVRQTNFGSLFDVRSVPAATDLAYTSLLLDAHTDNPYRNPVPGIQLLHCLVNETSGGLSTLVDGFSAAEHLRKTDPDAFDILARIPVQFRYRDATTELTASAPMIELDNAGRVRVVRFSPRLDFVPLLPPEELARFYRARRTLDQLLRSPERELRFLLASGDLMMFDNQRLLHGRTGFDPAEGHRHLQGCYIDIDGPRSLHRVLRRQAIPSTAAPTEEVLV